MVPKMTPRRHEKNSVIFPDNEICILLEGIVETKKHKAGLRIPEPCNIYRNGCVLGYDEGDNGITSNVETWSVCKSIVEAIWMKREDFKTLWQLHKKNKNFMLCQVVSQMPDF